MSGPLKVKNYKDPLKSSIVLEVKSKMICCCVQEAHFDNKIFSPV